MRILTVVCVTLMLATGCATHKTQLSPTACQAADWQAIGEADGKAGRYPHEIDRHTRACQGISTPDRILWEQGRQLGLQSYCTKANAYEVGRRGYNLNQVCPEEGLLELQQSHALGHQQYYRQERLFNRWYYGYPWYSPYPFWW